ncbi:putative uncharacterized protein DDB_G0294196 isoform X2 [Plutella xylostella]|uniref:putative uncharacterized protein DDB_G0294196 isoform X2 n=1 Tax=Plutella xylostella TaxID=51655 RepID=UPI002032462E|nr:putative uncharacterized protein DDB_G0294196 isoform X2 [Plutella xylostella]
MFTNTEKEITPVMDMDASDTKSPEAVRKCTNEEAFNTSWNIEHLNCSNDKLNCTPPSLKIMIDSSSPDKIENSTQTVPYSSHEPLQEVNLNKLELSFDKDDQQNSVTTDNPEKSFGSKRCRRDSQEDPNNLNPLKRTKCDKLAVQYDEEIEIEEPDLIDEISTASNNLSSCSEVSFKSVSSNSSLKGKKRRRKSDSNLFRDVLLRSKRSNHSNYSKQTSSRQDLNNTPGGTPRKDRGGRRISKSKSWRLIDLCTWIGMKGYESITALYTDGKGEEAKTIEKPKQENDSVNKDVQLMKKTLEDVVDRQDRLMRENEEMAMNMKKMMQKIEELENKLNQSECRPPTSGRSLATGDCAAPPPPPPPPPPPMPSSKLPVRSNTLPRCGSAPPRVAAPRLAITPQDIANVKLRKAKDNPNLRSKPNQNKQPLVTQQMLLSTRAGLGKKKHVSAATTQQQLSDLEKCLLQETSVTSMFRRRVARTTFKSTEELRPRPYPHSRSPRSPRSNSIPRIPHREKINIK